MTFSKRAIPLLQRRAGDLGGQSYVLESLAEREGRKEISTDGKSLLTRLTLLIPRQIPTKGEAEKVIFKALCETLNCWKTKRKDFRSLPGGGRREARAAHPEAQDSPAPQARMGLPDQHTGPGSGQQTSCDGHTAHWKRRGLRGGEIPTPGGSI